MSAAAIELLVVNIQDAGGKAERERELDFALMLRESVAPAPSHVH